MLRCTRAEGYGGSIHQIKKTILSKRDSLLLAGQMTRRCGLQEVEGGDPSRQGAPGLEAAIRRPIGQTEIIHLLIKLN